jgi:2-polyprenyl-3-methyl-5-hydroxy-6-metoxy-1,4-benzoquinol methylase
MGRKRENYWKDKWQADKVDITKFYNSYSGKNMLYAFDQLIPDNDPYDSLVDIGCGVGWYFQYFRMKKHISRLVGVDSAENPLKICKKKNPFVETKIDKIAKLSFSDGEFDVVLSMGLIEHFKDPKPILDEMVRILKKDGLLILETPNMLNLPHTIHRLINRKNMIWEHWWRPKDLKALVKSNSKLELQKSTSAILFAYKWAYFPLALHKMGICYDFITKVEHLPLFLPFGELMFVSARKTGDKLG